mgnify:CR=1 FL=1
MKNNNDFGIFNYKLQIIIIIIKRESEKKSMKSIRRTFYESKDGNKCMMMMMMMMVNVAIKLQFWIEITFFFAEPSNSMRKKNQNNFLSCFSSLECIVFDSFVWLVIWKQYLNWDKHLFFCYFNFVKIDFFLRNWNQYHHHHHCFTIIIILGEREMKIFWFEL